MQSPRRKSNPAVKSFSPEVLAGSKLSRRLVLLKAKSKNLGPVVWLTAGSHGDEVGGTRVIKDFFKKIQRQPLLKGALYALPVMNPWGKAANSRTIAPTKEDLNRAFPGKASGSLAQKIARQIFSAVTQTKPTLVLDLHTDWLNSLPYLPLDASRGVSKKVYQQTEKFSLQTGVVVARESDQETTKSLSAALLKQGIPALTLELPGRLSRKEIDRGVQAVTNLLAALKMIKLKTKPFRYPLPPSFRGKILNYSQKPLSPIKGKIKFFVKPDQVVKKGQILAKIYPAVGKPPKTLNALAAGLVLGTADSKLALPGEPVVVFGII